MPGIPRRRRLLVGGVLVLALVAAVVVVVVPRSDFSGHCVGDVGVAGGLADRRGLEAVVTDPLHLSARVPLDAGPPPPVGTPVVVPGGLVPPPSTDADVVAVGAPEGGATPVLMALRPLDQVGGFPGTPPMPTMTPGARGTVTALIDPIGKAETLSVDSLRPAPARIPGLATIYYSDDPAAGTVRAGTVVVTRVVEGRVLYEDPSGTIPVHTPGSAVAVVLPDRRCRTLGVWPPVLSSGRVVDASGDVRAAP